MSILIKNAQLVNENTIKSLDVYIEGDTIAKIGPDISIKKACKTIDAKGLYLIPGAIDDQVHFREPGLTHKETIKTGSLAALAGGITSFMEMPNTSPQAVTHDLLEKKFAQASKTSYANYSFKFGARTTILKR